MQTPYYSDALKLAQKEFRRCTAAGQHPYPPVLDAFVPAERFAGGVDLGTASIPMEFVVGTRTAARTNAFARNFMPLLPSSPTSGTTSARPTWTRASGSPSRSTST